MRQTSSVVYIAVDALIPVRGRAIPGFDEFTAALDHAGIPAVWLTSRSRLQFDEPRRKLGHRHPFIAEDGCGVYLPEDYFHLRPEPSAGRAAKSPTIRLGRFTCIPIAEPLPAASEVLEALAEGTGVSVVPLSSLSPRELAQNAGLPQREAELARQRDFDEIFFFAGAAPKGIEDFLREGRSRKLEFRQQGALWSAAVGASIPRCIGELSKLYDRALHHHAYSVAIGTREVASSFFPCCAHSILLVDHEPGPSAEVPRDSARTRQIPLQAEDIWERLLAVIRPGI